MSCDVGLFVESVLYVLWRGFVNGKCAVCVEAWVFLMDSVLYVLWRGFVKGLCAVSVVAWDC